MNINFPEAREQLLALHQSELNGLNALEAAVGRAQQFGFCQTVQVVAPRVSFPMPTRKSAKAPRIAKAAKPERPAGGSKKTSLMKRAVAKASEPFTAVDIVAGMKALDRFSAVDPRVCAANLKNWAKRGLLTIVEAGRPCNPGKFKRSHKWHIEGAVVSDKEQAYQEFRSSITPPKADDE